ncbi:hypothetical protein GCM10028816_45950 [Spirosoma lituiforme]
MLRDNGFFVETLLFDNEEFKKTNAMNKIGIFFDTLYNIGSAKIITEKIKRFRPDVIHIHNIFYRASPSVIIAANRMRVPVIMTLHNYRLVCSGTYLMRDKKIPCEQCIKKVFPLDGIRHSCFQKSKIKSIQLTLITSLHRLLGTWNKVDRFIVLTEFAKSKILESSLNLDENKIIVKPNSVHDLGYNDSKERSNYYLFVGRLSIEKGINTLLEATEMVPHIKMKIIGDGPLKVNVEEASKYTSSIEYLGAQPREIVIEYIKKCKALVIPSIWYEGLPTVLLEALSIGTPIICADNPNLRSILNGTAVFFTPNDASSLKEKLELDVLTNFKQIDSLKLRKIYESKYTQLKVLEQQIDIYKSMIRKNFNNSLVA